jgi:tetratricopeptide (TPR) repeat protein
MGRSWRKYRTLYLLVLGLLMLQVPLQEGIHRQRPDAFDPNRKNRPDIANVEGPTTAIIAALGGFRTVAADILWMKVDNLWDGGSWQYIPTLLESVVQLDPHFILAWRVYGWHLAYNLNAESKTLIDRRYWLDRGVEVLRRAVDVNPKAWEPRFELGWTLFDRAHRYPEAAGIFLEASKLQGSPAYIDRLYYRCYEHMLDFGHLWKALDYAESRLDKFPGENQHQRLVRRDKEYWQNNWNTPEAHRKEIVKENSARQQRALPPALFPGDPFWDVCPHCGLPSHKGATKCENPFCGAPMPGAKPEAPEAGGTS